MSENPATYNGRPLPAHSRNDVPEPRTPEERYNLQRQAHELFLLVERRFEQLLREKAKDGALPSLNAAHADYKEASANLAAINAAMDAVEAASTALDAVLDRIFRDREQDTPPTKADHE